MVYEPYEASLTRITGLGAAFADIALVNIATTINTAANKAANFFDFFIYKPP